MSRKEGTDAPWGATIVDIRLWLLVGASLIVVGVICRFVLPQSVGPVVANRMYGLNRVAPALFLAAGLIVLGKGIVAAMTHK